MRSRIQKTESNTVGDTGNRMQVANKPNAAAVQCRFDGVAHESSTGQSVRPNRTGMPDQLKGGLERLSGFDLSPVRVHYNSPKPARVGALAYAQGTHIHLGPGQEGHLPHEGWHVVQQMQGRVRPTTQYKGIDVNVDRSLEHEADVMGGKAAEQPESPSNVPKRQSTRLSPSADCSPLQRKVGFEYEMGAIRTQHWNFWRRNWGSHGKGDVLVRRNGYELTADVGQNQSQLEIIIHAIDETNAGELNNLINNTVPNVEQDIDDIAQNSHNVWTTADQIPNLNGSSWDRFQSAAANGAGVFGQLQMTGGISINDLADFVSGQHATNYIGANALALAPPNNHFLFVINNYIAANAQTYPNALAAVGANATVNGLLVAEQEIIAAIVTLLATIPLNTRAGGNIHYPKAAAGDFMARTDFSKILMMTPNTIKAALSANVLIALVLATINNTLNPLVPVAANDHLYPNPTLFDPGIPQLGQLTINAWITRMLPRAGWITGYWQGTDLLTKKNYPGNRGQRDAIESLGGYGSKTDPGNKAIFEFRTLGLVPGDMLVYSIDHLAHYLQ